MEKSSTSPVANPISNSDKRSCSRPPGEGRGQAGFVGLESLGSSPDFNPMGCLRLLSARKMGQIDGMAC